MTEPFAFPFVIALVGVVNGLGIVRWLSAFAEFLRRNHSLKVELFWTFNLFASYHFLAHILFWWSLWGVREAVTFNFLAYLYILAGPIFLFLGTSLLSTQGKDDSRNLREHYFEIRSTYWSVLIMMWLWAIFLWPLLIGSFAPTAPIFAINLLIAIILRFTANARIHFAMAVLSWAILVLFITLYAMQLGGVADMIE